MTINYTTLLGLTEPVTGTQSGTWGSDINTGLTDYVEAAIAGAQVISGSQTAVTLSVTTGSSSAPTTLSQAGSGATGSSQYQIIRCTGNPASTLVIDVPKQDKTYIVINATSTSQTVTLRGGPSTPTTGVNIVAGEKAVCAWNGSDFVKVGGAAGGTNTQVQYNNNGVFGGSADLTWDGSTLATTGLTASGAVTLSATSQNIALGTSQVGGTWTAGGASQTGAITLDQSTKTHTLNIGTGATENALTKTINLGTAGVSGSTTAINIGSAVSGATTNVTLNGTVQPGVVISGSSSGDALRITQTGAGNALLVEDDTNPDSTPFVVTAAGNVGIGTTSPAQALHVVSTGNQIKYPLRLQNDGTSGTTLGVGLQYYVYNGTSVANLGAIIGTGSTWSYGTYSANQMSISSSGSGGVRVATASAPITFHTGNADSDLSTERMRLDSSGNLGLGVTPSGSWGSPALMLGKPGASNPTYPFLTSTDTQQLVIGSNSYWDGTNWKAQFGGSGVVAMQMRVVYNAFTWHTAPAVTTGNNQTFTQAMTLTSGGDLLVGSTSTSGSSSNTKQILGGNFRTFYNTATIAASATATILTLSSSVTGVYIVNANFGAQGNAIYGGMAIIVANAGSFRIVTNGGGSSSALSLSGANVQITNALGSPLDATATAIFIGN